MHILDLVTIYIAHMYMFSALSYLFSCLFHAAYMQMYANACSIVYHLGMKTRVSSHGIAALLLQYHLEKPQTWMPMVSWATA